jgi:hypothetical protein
MNVLDSHNVRVEELDRCVDFEGVETGVAGIHIVDAGSRLPERRRYLCFFNHRHLSFRLAEVEAAADFLYGASLSCPLLSRQSSGS